MPAGPLRHRIQIQSLVEELDTYGEAPEQGQWTTDATVWGSVTPLRGREAFEAKQVSPEVSHRVRLRFREGVTSKNRLVHRSRVFGIEDVLNVDERNEFLEILAIEAI